MSNEDNVELTDGFHVLMDALKMNDINTMYGVVGIPITNLARLWEQDGRSSTASATNSTLATPHPLLATSRAINLAYA